MYQSWRPIGSLAKAADPMVASRTSQMRCAQHRCVLVPVESKRLEIDHSGTRRAMRPKHDHPLWTADCTSWTGDWYGGHGLHHLGLRCN